MLNNKGQSLVLFVLIIPVVLIILVLVVDIGRLILLRGELDNINYLAIDYALSNSDDDLLEEKISEIIKKNKEDISDISIKVEEGKIYVTFFSSIDSIVGFSNISLYSVESSYVGYILNNNKVIERVK